MVVKKDFKIKFTKKCSYHKRTSKTISRIFSSFCHSECFALLRTLCVCHSSKSTIMAFEASEEQEEVEEAAHKRENVKCLFCVTSGLTEEERKRVSGII